MRTITGVFTDVKATIQATRALQALIDDEHVNLLAPTVGDEVDEVPTTQDMPPVVGSMGGVLGGALGFAVSMAIPGVGQVTGLGLAAAAILAALGSVAGYKLGDAADRVGSTGLPVDELYFYEDALRTGRSVVFAAVEDKRDEDTVRAILSDFGAESIDAARARWTTGLRDASDEVFDTQNAG